MHVCLHMHACICAHIMYIPQSLAVHVITQYKVYAHNTSTIGQYTIHLEIVIVKCNPAT